MKILKLFFIGVNLFLANSLQAQVSVNVNIGTPPPWGPAGYTEVRYYYLPDVEAYYDVQTSMFIYFGGGVWVHRTYLPTQYRSYDLYSGYKVVMTDYRGETPYNNFADYKTRYAKGYHGAAQKTIGERPAGKKTEAKPSRPVNRNNKAVAPEKSKSTSPVIKGNDKGKQQDNNKGGGNGKKK